MKRILFTLVIISVALIGLSIACAADADSGCSNSTIIHDSQSVAHVAGLDQTKHPDLWSTHDELKKTHDDKTSKKASHHKVKKMHKVITPKKASHHKVKKMHKVVNPKIASQHKKMHKVINPKAASQHKKMHKVINPKIASQHKKMHKVVKPKIASHHKKMHKGLIPKSILRQIVPVLKWTHHDRDPRGAFPDSNSNSTIGSGDECPSCAVLGGSLGGGGEEHYY